MPPEEAEPGMPPEGVDKLGLLPAERAVVGALISAAESFSRLPVQHPDDQSVFIDAIHVCQQLLALRVARRVFPEAWAVYGPEEPAAATRTGG